MIRLFSILFLLISSIRAWPQPRYITTIHPLVEILSTITGERGQVRGILPAGASPHTYELRPSDIHRVEGATALFVGGKNLDDWAFKFRHKNEIILLDLVPKMYLLTMKEQLHRAHETGESHNHAAGSIDPHFWTDPLLVKALLPNLTEQLCALDPAGCMIYRKNSAEFANQLDSLHEKITKMLEPAREKSVLLAHPFFQYFLERYHIHLAGSIELSPGIELTPRELKTMIDIIKTKDIKAIFTHPQLPDRPAKLIAEAAGIKVFELDPIGGSPGRQSYAELLLYNATIICEALR